MAEMGHDLPFAGNDDRSHWQRENTLTPLWSAPSLMTIRHRCEFALNALVTELICRPPSPRVGSGRKGPTFS
jgi:hypothetical protein